MRLEINYKKKDCKKHKHVQIKNMILNKQWVTEEIKKYPEIDENRNDSKHNDENRNTMI